MPMDEKTPLLGHLEELRRRLIACAVAVAVGFAVSYVFAEEIFQVLIWPLKTQMKEGEKLVFTNLPEMFFIYLKTAFVAGILFSTPYVFLQAWLFVAPGLYRNERRYLIPFVVSSTVLFVGGALFGYFVVFPLGFQFFLSFGSEHIQALPSVQEYFSLSIRLLFAFGLVFELPVILFFLAKVGIVTPGFLKENRKYAILMAFIVGAILTPPDVISQFMMAIPLIVLYEIGILVTRIAVRNGREEESEAEGKEG